MSAYAPKLNEKRCSVNPVADGSLYNYTMSETTTYLFPKSRVTFSILTIGANLSYNGVSSLQNRLALMGLTHPNLTYPNPDNSIGQRLGLVTA